MRLTEDQEAGLLAIRDCPRVVIRSCNSVGKTALGAFAVLWFGFSFFGEGARIVTTATVGRQVKAQLWSEIPRFYGSARFHLGGAMGVATWTYDPSAFGIGFSTDKVDRFQGWHAPRLLFVLDEASGLSPGIFEGVEGSMAGEHARCLVLGNPLRPEGQFYQCFQSPEWCKLKMAAERHPNVVANREIIPGAITREWMEGRLRDWGPTSPQYIARVQGDFPASAEDTLIPLEWVEAARRIEAAPHSSDDVLCMGVDIARYGSDASVALIRDDLAVRNIVSWRGRSTMDTAGRIKSLSERFGISPEMVFLDDVGVGGGVTDRLREQDFAVTPVQNGAKAEDDERFANVRAESYWAVREMLNPERAARLAIHHGGPGHDMLAAELAQPRYAFTSKGQIKIESKEEIKRRLGHSPDYADALALTFARPQVQDFVIG